MVARRPLLVVTRKLDVGGAEQHLLRVLPLVAGERTVRVQVLHGGGTLEPQFRAAGIAVDGPGPHLHGWKRMAAALWLTARALAAYRRGIVQFVLPEAYLVAAPLAVLLGVKRLVMSRRSRNHYQTRHPRAARVEHWLHGRMAALLGNSARVTADLADEGAARDRIHLIYNGIEPAAAKTDRAAVRTALAIDSQALVLATVANLIPYKGHSDLIDALARIRTGLPAQWALLCVGRDDGIGAELRARAEAAGIGSHIHWLGSRADVPDLLAASDIALLCSHEEGFSNAVLEGMAAGLPMVVTDVGGNAEAVEDGVSGLVVPPRDPEALAHAITRLAGDAAARARMGAAAAARVRERFSLDACARAYGELYAALDRL